MPYARTRFLTRGGLSGVPPALERLPRLARPARAERTLALVDALDGRGRPRSHTTNLVAVDARGQRLRADDEPRPRLRRLAARARPAPEQHARRGRPARRAARARRADAEHDGARASRSTTTASRSRSARPAARASERRSSASPRAILDEGLEPQAAVDRPRVHPAGDVVNAEPGVDEEALAELEAAGPHRAALARAAPLLRRRRASSARGAAADPRGAARRRPPLTQRDRSAGATHRPEGPSTTLSSERQIGDPVRAAAASRPGASTSRAIWSISSCSLLERPLVAQPPPELDDEALPVQVAVEVEQERLDPPLVAAVMRVRTDRDRCALDRRQRRRRCRSPGRAGPASTARFAVGKPSVPPRASPPTTMPSTSAGRPSSPAAPATSPPWSSCRIAVDDTPSTDRDDPYVEAEPLAAGRDRPRACARSGNRARRRRPRRRSAEVFPCEVLGLDPLEIERELDHERLLHAELREQLEPPLERRQQLDAVTRARGADAGRT